MNQLSNASIKANRQYHEALAKKLAQQLAEQYKKISDCIDAKQFNNQILKASYLWLPK